MNILKNTMKNEKGSVLVLMIAVTFVVSYLLLMIATQIQVRVASYERTRTYLTLNLLEQEGLYQLEVFLADMEVLEDFSDIWFLRDGDKMLINGEKLGKYFAISYEIRYNEYVRARQLRFCLELGYIHWHTD